MPVQQRIGAFLQTIPGFPFQAGSSLNAAGINYRSLKAMEAMNRLEQLESFQAPTGQ